MNIGSVTAAMGSPVEVGYGAAKAGLVGLTRSLARAVARKGITVNLVVPGVFETEMTASMRPEAQEAIKAMIPLGRRGDPRELACAVRFLLSDEASYITGSVRDRGRRPLHGRLTRRLSAPRRVRPQGARRRGHSAPNSLTALSRRILRCCGPVSPSSRLGELGRLGQALRVREVGAHHQAVHVGQVADDLGMSSSG